ncbi:715_t:CDS:2 [Entrophospora sp. SA101]|nr:7313_t:CDS:2 [Entrophospora sp. SA101]CAJ0755424.1 8502_t:CDS:2 [Entrophospora sp. SA101]CAJ0763915.1 715_t:CDS:2 [Entrophospora sp. SA101]CAJ0823371.1 4736_t:CDS:2 [Entrophospora sp. SA101]CAJ0861591.1 9135_t:CDS:2 [Entrophospora sp. SA101]
MDDKRESRSDTTSNRDLSLYVRWNNGGDALYDLFKQYGEIRDFNLSRVYQEVPEEEIFNDPNLLGSTTIIVKKRKDEEGNYNSNSDRRRNNKNYNNPCSFNNNDNSS